MNNWNSTIPHVGKPVFRLVLGSASLSLPEKENMYALLDEHVKLGGNAIETAHQYREGESEHLIGMWMKDRGLRDRVVIITKGGHPFDGRSRIFQECVVMDLEESLRRLQTDYVDVYMLHRDDPSRPVSEIVDFLNVLHNQGKIKAFGGSNWKPDRIEAANAYAKETNQIPFVVSSPHFALAVPHREPWPGCIALTVDDVNWYEKQDLSVIVWSPLARGFFTGRYTPDEVDEAGVVEAWFSKDNFERLKRAQDLAQQKNVSPAAIALAYVFAQSFKPIAAVGAQNLDELRDSYSALNCELTADQVTWLGTEDLRGEAR